MTEQNKKILSLSLKIPVGLSVLLILSGVVFKTAGANFYAAVLKTGISLLLTIPPAEIILIAALYIKEKEYKYASAAFFTVLIFGFIFFAKR